MTWRRARISISAQPGQAGRASSPDPKIRLSHAVGPGQGDLAWALGTQVPRPLWRSRHSPGRPEGPWASCSPGHPPDRRDHVLNKITVRSGAERHPRRDAEAAGRSAFDGDLGRLKAGSAGRMAVPAGARLAGVTAANW